jgi:hypothetical protein
MEYWAADGAVQYQVADGAVCTTQLREYAVHYQEADAAVQDSTTVDWRALCTVYAISENACVTNHSLRV